MRSASFVLVWMAAAMCAGRLLAQQPPTIGFMFPPGGRAGTTVDVVLGGYDWTPDTEVLVHDDRVKLELIGPPGPVIVPEPPYWFGKKARRPPFLLPRETPAKLTIPADMPPGIVRWQAVNANGATQVGHFVVGAAEEIVEVRGRIEPQQIAKLPVTISGQILKIEQVDRYQFTATATGLMTCHALTQAIGSPLDAAVEVRDAAGQLVADVADTEGRDAVITFAAKEGQQYTVSVYDVDFRGNRAFVYRLSISPGPRLLAAIPAAGRRGETREVELVGFGVATGKALLESVTRKVTFPKDVAAASHSYRLETPFGTTPPISFLLSDLNESAEPATGDLAARKLNLPAAITGCLEKRYGEDRYLVEGKKGDTWSISAAAVTIGSPLDVAVSVFDAEGKLIRGNDDLPGTTDAGLEFKVAADGPYQIAVSDTSGKSGSRAATYRLVVQPAAPAFTLSAPELLNVPIDGTAQLSVTVKRHGGFKDAIALSLAGLPAGIVLPEKLEIPAGKNLARVAITAAADSATGASLATLTGTATIGEQPVTKTSGKLLVAVVMKPPFAVDAEGKDDVTKWPRGTTFPAPVLIEREAGFNGDIVLEMASKQGRHRQGIRGPELVVPPGVGRILYPVFLPEWLETTRTSRIVLNGVAKVPDPKGNVRYSVSRLKTRIGFLPGGALLKVSSTVKELSVEPGAPLEVPVIVSRSRDLKEDARLELRLDDELAGLFTTEPVTLEAGQKEAVLRLTPAPGKLPHGERELVVRATVMQHGHLPVVAEAAVLAIFPEQ